MEIQVDYSRIVFGAAGRKWPSIKAITMEEINNNINFHFINDKTNLPTTDFKVSIPKENIPDVINALKQFI